MVRGVVRIRLQRHNLELWIQDEEILGQPAVSEQTTALTGDVCAAVQKIPNLTDVYRLQDAPEFPLGRSAADRLLSYRSPYPPRYVDPISI